jgi:hypothetical protein
MQEEKTVDIDTSGPGAEIELETPKSELEVSHETTDSKESVDASEKLDEQSNVQASEAGTTDQEQKESSEEDNEKKKELDDYSEGVKKRIAKLTKKMREAERREQAAIDYAKSVLTEQETLKGRLTKLDTGYVSEMENRIKSSKEAAIAKLAKAREDGNLELEVAAQTEISRLGYEEARLSEIKSRQETQIETPVQTRQSQLQQEPVDTVDPKAQSWAQKNPWFNTDKVMKSAAIAIHEQLTEEEGYDPRSDEYYTEIDKRIRLEFPHKFGNNETQNSTREKPTQVVASASRSSKPGRKTVRLTPSQVAIAKKLGVPLELYAKQLTTKE